MRFLALSCLAIALTGCATTPPLPTKIGPPPIIGHRLDAPDLAATYAAAGVPAPQGGVLTADQATIAALYFNPALAAARAGATRAAADAVVAAQRANPVLSFTPDSVLNAAAGMIPWTVALTLALPLLYPGQDAARQKVRAATEDAVRLDLAQAGWQARSDAVTALRTLLAARAASALAQVVAGKDAERLAASDRLFAAHQTSRAERALVLDAAARSAAQMPLRAGAVLAAQTQLAAALGLPPAHGAKLEPSWPNWQSPPPLAQLDTGNGNAGPGAFDDAALFNRLDVQAALARLRAADAGYTEARAGAHPDLAVTPGYTYDKGDHRLQFGIDIAPPLFHDSSAKVAAARAARDEARARVEALQSVVLDEVAARRADYSAKYAAFVAFGPILDVAQAEVDRARRELAAGSGDRPALLDAQARLLTTQLAQVDAQLAVLSAVGALENAVQRPLWPESQIGNLRAAPPAGGGQ